MYQYSAVNIYVFYLIMKSKGSKLQEVFEKVSCVVHYADVVPENALLFQSCKFHGRDTLLCVTFVGEVLYIASLLINSKRKI